MHQLVEVYQIQNLVVGMESTECHDISECKLWDKELFDNNLLDIYAGMSLIWEDLCEYRACVIIKYNNLCTGGTIAKMDDVKICVFKKSLNIDSKSFFSGYNL